jgi:glycine/D-amino acid oxidase-like deaminating enzyme
MKVVVVGSGVFGVTGALELQRRGHHVTLFDAGTIPHPLAESTDVSKAVRMDYGDDELYASEMEKAIEAWRAWNVELGQTVFHATGAMFVSKEPFAPGGYEHASLTLLTRRGHVLERLDRESIERRSPLRGFVDGYFNPHDGWADSGLVIERLAALARRLGVEVCENAKVVAVDPGAVVFADGARVGCDIVVVAAGGWTRDLVPEIAPCFKTMAQPVFHVDGSGGTSVFGADLAKTGWYGFPARDGFVKIANHGPGRAMHPDTTDRSITGEEEARLRTFLRASIPSLAERPLKTTRVCVYSDTHDEHFWIAPHPDDARLVVATGGSGHAFKFATRIGEWIARAVEGDVVPRFRWRSDLRTPRDQEAPRR